ncbi:MAG: M42 family peptidase, partial [Oscillospiraceae bacterium]
LILREIEPYADSIAVTPLGNIIAEKKGKQMPNQKLMLSAHMDEVGMIVTDIDEKGFLSFATVGGIDNSVLLGKSVLVNENISGVIGGKPVHLMSGDELERAIPVEKLTVDIGAATKEEAKKVVSIGDSIHFLPFFECLRGTVKGKALDDRVGCLLLVELLKTDLEFDTSFTFSVQEEVGLRGAQTAANIALPDIVIAVEGTVAGDVLDTKGAKAVTKMGKGPAVSIIDKGTMYDREFFKLAFEIAKELNIPCQPRTGAVGTNDAGAMHKAGRGARAIAVSVPCRYIHSPLSMARVSDMENAFLLLRELVKRVHD